MMVGAAAGCMPIIWSTQPARARMGAVRRSWGAMNTIALMVSPSLHRLLEAVDWAVMSAAGRLPLFSRLLGETAAPALEALDRVAAAGEWRAVPHLLHLSVHPHAQVRAKAIEVIEGLARRIPSDRLVELERDVRAMTLQAYPWHEMTLHDVERPEWPVMMWALFTMHPSGFIREAAVKQIGDVAVDPLLTGFLLLRVNDWVEQVRDAALRALEPRLAGPVEVMLPNLGLLWLLQERKRTDHRPLLEAVREQLLDPRAEGVLMSAIASPDQVTARTAFEIACAAPDERRIVFIERGLKHCDPIIRLMSARAARRLGPAGHGLLSPVRNDPSMPVRREALYAALSTPEEQRREILMAALLDWHPSIRHAARVYLREMDHESAPDFRTFYLSAAQHDKLRMLAAAVGGVGETGILEDVPWLIAMAAHERTRVAAAAVQAVATLDRTGQQEWLESLLDDARPGVAREAARGLRPIARQLSFDRLAERVRGGMHPHTRRQTLMLLCRHHAYDVLPVVLAEAVRRDPATESQCIAYLAGFGSHGRTSLIVSDAQLAAAKRALEECAGGVPPWVLAHLRAVV
jgi:HEAT repeat protein